MKAMIYVIRFEDEQYFGDIGFYLKEVESPVRLEIGDKIILNHASFDRTRVDDDIFDIFDIDEMMGLLMKKSIISSRYGATFEISDITYNHEYFYVDNEINFHGIITLKGK